MRLYHGSNVTIESIDLSKSKTNKDFGCGFYLSADYEQAQEMAQFKSLTKGGEQCVTVFELDEAFLSDGVLKIKKFTEYDEEWAEFVLQNRKNYSRRNVHPYDIVYGPIADDKVGPQIRRFENGDFDMTELLRRLKYMKGITFQYFFGTEKSLEYLRRV